MKLMDVPVIFTREIQSTDCAPEPFEGLGCFAPNNPPKWPLMVGFFSIGHGDVPKLCSFTRGYSSIDMTHMLHGAGIYGI